MRTYISRGFFWSAFVLLLIAIIAAALGWTLVFAASAGAGVTSAIAYAIVRSFARRIARLRHYSEGLPDEPLPDEALPGGSDELGELSRSLRQTAARTRDLVNRLQLESAQRQSILASMAEGVLAVDRELRVIFCNGSFARAAGAHAPVREGMPLVELVRDPGLMNIVLTVVKTGNSVNRRIQLRAAEARTFEVQASGLAGPEAYGALAILHDITAIERLERVRKDFVANVSHELRTPLASIRGYAETLLDGALEDPDHNRQFVERILAQAIRLNNIASDLLILSELESTGTVPQVQRISIRAALESVVRTVESAARVHQVKLVAGQVPDLYVLGQEIRLEQALVNLLDNAVKFNRPNGEVRIQTGAAGGMVSISIADTGVGIPSEDLPRIFERFYRVDKARSREVGGTGLGLSIVRHVVQLMGGSVQVQSELGKGSQFTLTIPQRE